jgi:hypothetical protein
MKRAHNFRRASRRYEMLVHDGVPESPQPMYQESTHGKTTARLTGQASDTPASLRTGGKVAVVFYLRGGEVVSESPRGRRDKTS